MPQPPATPASNSPSSAAGSPHWRTPDWATRTLTGIETIRPEYQQAKPTTPTLRREVAAWLAEHDRLIRPAADGSIRDWLTALGLQVAGGAMSAEEATLRIGAYADTLAGKPGYWFTRMTLRNCAERFKWFPSLAELVEFMRGLTIDKDQQVALARKILESPDSGPRVNHMPRTKAARLAELDAIREANGLKPGEKLSALIRAAPRRMDDEPLAGEYVWIMPNGASIIAAERPEGGKSISEYQAEQNARTAA